MKRKAMAVILCLALILTATLPGTLAVSVAQDTTIGGFEAETPTTEAPTESATEITDPTGDAPQETTLATEPGDTTGGDQNSTDATDAGETTPPTDATGEPNDPQCTCAREDGEHDEGCPLYEDKEEEEPFDPQKVYEELMACETCQQMDEITAKLTDEQLAQFSEDMVKNILLHYVSLIPANPNARVYGDHAPNFSSVGPLVGNTGSTRPRIAGYAVRGVARDAGSTTGGLQLSKTSTANDDGTYTITLEAFATGSQVTTIVKAGVDIVLMLDLSDYMLGQTTYAEVGPFTYSQLYQNIQNGQAYFAKNGSEYKQVRVTMGSWYGITYYSLSYDDGSGEIGTAYDGNSTVGTSLYQVSTENNLAKLNALKAAVTTFINKVNAEAPASRIAIVPFSTNASVASGTLDATEGALVTVDEAGKTALLNIVNSLSVWGGNSNSHYAAEKAVKIFQDVPTDSAEYSRQRVAVLFSAGVSGTGWETDTGKQAFTSGQSVGQATMTLAYILKYPKGQTFDTAPAGNMDSGKSWAAFRSEGYFTDTQYIGCGATMYCVGLDIPTSGDPTVANMNNEPYKSGALANEYFWRTSSHRQDGTHIMNGYETTETGKQQAVSAAFGQTGLTAYNGRPSGVNYASLYFFYPDSLTRNQTNGYYLTTTSGSASDLAQLTAIFDKIAGQATTNTSSSTTLTESAVIKDIVAPEFKLPEGATAKDITVESYDFNGMNGDTYTFKTTKNNLSATPTISADGIISVTGFDFSKNWCGTDTNVGTTSNHGAKLVISFKVESKTGFLGGNNVYTNTSAGVYADGNAETPVQEFERPQVNVQIPNITVNPAEKNVYLMGSLTGEQIKSGATASCGDAELNLDPTVTNYGLEEWQNAYVDISVSYKDDKGNVVTDISGLQNDTTYQVLVTVSPKEDAKTTSSGTAAAEKTGNGVGKINVFKPTLTFKDSTVYYGDTAPTSYDGNLTKTEWKHNATLDTAVTMVGTVPTLSMTYDPGDGVKDSKIATKNDIPVDVTVKIGTTDVTNHTGFVHTKCDINETAPTDGKFWLHVNTCTLTITKAAGANTTIGDDEYFVFNIMKDGKLYTQVTIQATRSVTISELPVGIYTVEEDAFTAWRYAYSSIDGSGNLTATNPVGQFTCTNDNKTNQWLNFFNRVINVLGKANPTPDFNQK